MNVLFLPRIFRNCFIVSVRLQLKVEDEKDENTIMFLWVGGEKGRKEEMSERSGDEA